MVKKTILESLFNRKGGEGIKTRLIKNNTSLLTNINYKIKENETPILIYFIDDESWMLFTDVKIAFNKKNQLLELEYNNLTHVKPALSEEIKNGVTKADNFTRLLLTFNNKSSLIIDVEKGPPYKGIYQMLHYITTMNND
ncbi:hypothetical protein MP477_11505 [Chryseobacterium sp. WG23]|uniref:hypothetical protein n=1 Tax=Chryseobacterium sp. WG23 TaxID=2926910 RepID=UPI00211DE617|nr:hypothetical protein [Chryseobacterium sp. WG23]MCQ9635585.1 hypothetical protein [Chryseobacterium sp. WG23]